MKFRYLYFLFLCTTTLFAQKELHFDTFLHYEYQKNSIKRKISFLTSKKNPEYTLVVFAAQNGICATSLFKYDSQVCHSEVILNDFLTEEKTFMQTKNAFTLNVEDFRQDNIHFVFKEICQNPIQYEFETTLPKRKVKNHAVQIVQMEMIPGTENEIMFSNGTVLKSLTSKVEAKYQGIPSKITYLRAEDRSLMYTLTFVEKINVSKKILIEKLEPKYLSN